MASDQSRYAIHAAAREGKVTVVESLLNADPKLARLKDDDGRLPIHWAASANSQPIVLMLAQQKDFDPDVEDGSGWTPLMIAASVKDGGAVVELLLSRGADVNQKNNNGQVRCRAKMFEWTYRPVIDTSTDSSPLRRFQEQPRRSS
ncbi:ankyrin repeat-containing domain protein [Daldinia vernicosa]|uniref:ankyrin repeat-containing domain protein n=1 Tax=Daldinia vernicosa TaxID=114800 RepID=UPI002008B76A|nr:ankyrin repeat-containing domain protein [Daldinia vernicosa]KAI0845635.1 ankyrin repeat-containing domain protein [Daldinia vernicosa]